MVELAVAAEAAGWEALCIWDHCHFGGGVGDPWVTLTAVAAATTRLRLVTDVSPVPRYRPHMLARSLHALDVFSGGRVTFGAGLGVAEDLEPLGDHADDRTRAAMTDEALGLITRWCQGEVVDHHGTHYRSDGAQIGRRSVQQPRMPVWIGGWSRPAMRRAARWDGWILSAIDENQAVWFGPERVAEGLAYLTEHREAAAAGAAPLSPSPTPFDVAVNGTTPAGGVGMTREFAEAGATWWLESLFGLRGTHAEMLERVTAGPPG